MGRRSTYEDLIARFGVRQAPREVTQEQFDRDQESLERLARSDERTVQIGDLFEYALDLQYQELQPDLLRHALPLCLKVWRDSLILGDEHGGFAQQFHASLAATMQWKELLADHERDAVFEFMRDTLLTSLESQRGLRFEGRHKPAPAWPVVLWADPVVTADLSQSIGRPRQDPYFWTYYLASLGTFCDRIPSLWREWWSFHTPGAAVAALQYASCLMYPEDDNPVFTQWTSQGGGGPPSLWEYESLGFDERWLPENVEFLRLTLDPSYVKAKLEAAVARLVGEPEHEQACRILRDFDGRAAVVAERLRVLPDRLATPSAPGPLKW
jgi:hypothetical protein